MHANRITRRSACGSLAAAAVLGLPTARSAEPAPSVTAMLTRTIPRSGDHVPIVGMGSSGTFDVGLADAERTELGAVLQSLFERGGRVIDTSPMYGRSEEVLGKLLTARKPPAEAWLATKVWTRGREAGLRQIRDSMHKLQTQRLDLLQIHNLLDWREHLPTLRQLQADGVVKHSGITHYRADAHAEVEAVLREERFDWLQINYSLGEREAEQRLLPFCAEQGIAVMVNRPFQDGALFERVRGRALPGWAADIGCTSWGQFFLKYVLSHPAVTCAIPATARARHMLDNAAAGTAPMPDAKQRLQMARELDAGN